MFGDLASIVWFTRICETELGTLLIIVSILKSEKSIFLEIDY